MSAQLKMAKARSLGWQGDPGLFSFLGKAVKGIAGAILPSIPGGSLVNRVIQSVGASSAPSIPTQVVRALPAVQGLQGISKMFPIPAGGLPGLPGRGLGITQQMGLTTLGTGIRKKYRRMNPLNPKALRRSIKRVSRFQEFARDVGFTRAPAKFKGVHQHKAKRR